MGQAAKIKVDSAGLVSLDSSYLTEPIFAIYNSVVAAGKTLIDIGINPNLIGNFYFQLSGEKGKGTGKQNGGVKWLIYTGI